MTMLALGAALIVLVLGAAGCGSVFMKPAFNDYSVTYAETQNRQMLLNLARLHERHPIYFFQLGQITASYTFTGTAGFAQGTAVRSQTGPNTVGINNATLGATLTHNPIFTFIPLSGDNYAKQLLTPISSAVFMELFEEGWPIDLLMRTLIERVEVDHENRHLVFENDPGAAEGYDRFLFACALARKLQQQGTLNLVTETTFVPVSADAVFDRAPTATEIMDADKQNLVWRRSASANNPWQLGRLVTARIFRIDKANDELVQGQVQLLGSQAPYNTPEGARGLKLFVDVMGKGYTVHDTPSGGAEGNNRLVMRSLMGAMAAMAAEQGAFESRSLDRIPPEERFPALLLTRPNRGSPADSLVALRYFDKNFAVSDAEPAPLQSATWNRDVFFLLIQLSYQVTTNPTALTTPSVIQIH
jgi:hypothetical protein